MLVINRRLRVRDDGTGRGRDEDVTIDEFGAIVVLGDPGIGKSTLFKQFPKSYQTVRNFLIAPKVASPQPLFLDAFDAVGGLVVVFVSERVQDLNDEDGDVHAAFVF